MKMHCKNVFKLTPQEQSGKPGTIRESNQASGVRKAHYAYVWKRFC